jgi:hypothetical protein
VVDNSTGSSSAILIFRLHSAWHGLGKEASKAVQHGWGWFERTIYTHCAVTTCKCEHEKMLIETMCSFTPPHRQDPPIRTELSCCQV